LGADPIGDLGLNGFILLALSTLGGAAWFVVSWLLVRFSREWAERLGIYP
jgi:hypothetical protein